WAGEAHPKNGGPFTYCSITSEYENGIGLTFVLTRELNFGVYLFSAAWSLKKGDSYDVVYSIDRGRRHAAKATAVSDRGVLINFAGARETFEQVKSGSALLVEAAGGRFRFDLGGTSAALDRMLDCVNNHLRAAGPGGRNPFASEEQARPQQRSERTTPRSEGGARQPAQASAEARARAAAFVEKLLLRAELYSFEILTGEQVPEEFRHFDVVWEGYHVIGILEILPRGTFRSIDEAADQTIEAVKQSCGGKSTSKGRAIRVDDRRSLIQIAANCTDKQQLFFDYTLMPVAEGGFYRILHLSSADPEAGRAANAHIGAALPLMLAGK
ncbi:MAG: hypothetical protein ACM3N5_06855, partial [Candidatus Eiseniibacteriota bacterium]